MRVALKAISNHNDREIFLELAMAAYRSIILLITCSAILFLGNGLLVTLLPVRANLEGFSTTAIGFIGTALYAGFIVGCVIGPRVVRLVGHVRCFAGFAALAALGSLLYPLVISAPVWGVLRFLTGICFAILYMSVESWLNEESSNDNRGRVLSAYIIITNVVTIGGLLMLNLYPPDNAALFSLVAILVCLSLVPLVLTPAPTPIPIEDASIDLPGLFRLSPVGVVGCLLVGLVEGAFWSLGPEFAHGQGMSIPQITLFMSMFVVGGTLSQWPLGRASDRLDRRLVIAFCCLGAMGTGLTITFLPLDSKIIALVLAAVHGGFMIPIYALCLAHANDYADTEKLVQTSSGLLLVYALGAVAGPMMVAPLMEKYSLSVLFLSIVVILGLLSAFCIYRMAVRPVAAADDRADFVPVPKTTHSVYTLEQDDELEEEVLD